MQHMKIVIAPDSFKGTMSSIEVCEIIEKAINDFTPDIKTVKVPIADGGEGTVNAFLCAAGGEKISVRVKDPLMRDIDAYYGILDDGETAVIEMAQASGIMRVEGNLKPLNATTYGTGQLIKDALDKGCRKILIGLGGSATIDGGSGIAAALGVRFLTRDGKEISPNGGGLGDLEKLDASGLDKRLANVRIHLACDVDNYLCGEKGAARVFGPQKGASPEEVTVLDHNLHHYATIIKRQFGIDVCHIKGGGAAGGLGVSLVAFAGAKIFSGIKIVLETIKFDEIIRDAGLVITGEGKIDSQTIHGKVPVGVARAAKRFDVPVIAIGGSIKDGYEPLYAEGIHAVFSVVNDIVPFETIKKTCRNDLYDLVRNLLIFSKIKI